MLWRHPGCDANYPGITSKHAQCPLHAPSDWQNTDIHPFQQTITFSMLVCLRREFYNFTNSNYTIFVLCYYTCLYSFHKEKATYCKFEDHHGVRFANNLIVGSLVEESTHHSALFGDLHTSMLMMYVCTHISLCLCYVWMICCMSASHQHHVPDGRRILLMHWMHSCSQHVKTSHSSIRRQH
jgi:hypothetical protein